MKYQHVLVTFSVILISLTACGSVSDDTVQPSVMPGESTILVPASSITPEALLIPTNTATQIVLSPTPTVVPTAHPENGMYYEIVDYELRIYKGEDSELVDSVNLFAYYPIMPTDSIVDSPYYLLWYEPVWSPNGRYLAFLGAIEGPSSDVYVFDTNSLEVKRLTSGENQAVKPEWSPDSEWIVHGEMVDARWEDGCIGVWAARADGGEVRWLYAPKGSLNIIGWVGLNKFYAFDHRATGNIILRYVDVNNGTVTIIYDFSEYGGTVYYYAYDPESGAFAFIPFMGYEVPDFYSVEGVYLTTSWAPTPRLIVPLPSSYNPILIWVKELGKFITPEICGEGKYTAFTPEGVISCEEYEP